MLYSLLINHRVRKPVVYPLCLRRIGYRDIIHQERDAHLRTIVQMLTTRAPDMAIETTNR